MKTDYTDLLAVACLRPIISVGSVYNRLFPSGGSSSRLLPRECSGDIVDSGSNQTWQLKI